MKRFVRAALLLPAALVLAAAAGKPARAPKQKELFPPLRDRYVKTFFGRFPVVASYLGASGLDPKFAALDGKLRDFSPAAMRQERTEWETFRAELAKVDAAALSESDRIDADVISSQLGFLLRCLDRRLPERALDATLDEAFRGVEWLLQGMAPGEGEQRGTAAEWTRVAERVEAIPAYLKTALANTRRGAAAGVLPDRRLIRGAVETALSSGAYFEKALPSQAAAQLPQGGDALRERLDKGSAAAARAFSDYRQGLLDLFFTAGGATLRPEFDRDRYAAGVVEYSRALRSDLHVTKSPQELFREGREQVAGTLQEMTILARAIAAAHDWDDSSLPSVFTRLSQDAPRNDDEMLAWYREGTARLVDYGRREKLFDVPSNYELDVVFTPPPLRDTIGAAYYPAPPFKKTGVGTFFVTPTGNDPALLKESPRASIADLVAHEGFPGHDWHYQLLRQRVATISPVRWLTPGGVEDSTSMWEDSMATEGWALYAEELVGLPRPDAPKGVYTPEERLFQLQNLVLRQARIVVDPGLHCGFMTFDEALAYFARNVYFVKGPVSKDPKKNPDAFERASVDTAEKDIYRYSKWPGQAVTYLLGEQAILELKAEVQTIEGDRFDERRFHEEFLSFGTIPPALFHEALLTGARKRAAVAAAP